MTLLVQSPAKLNLFLHITGRRADGYHTLQTLFQFVELHDSLEFSVTDDGKILLDSPIKGLAPGDNLIEKAAALLQRHSRCTQGAHIKLTKRLPMGGGMGGGSSNAASTLVALNQLWQTGLNKQQLSDLGLQLGADVPIFIHGHCALATGVGEAFENVEIEQPWYLIAMPNCHADTRELFQQKQLTRDSKEIRIRDFLEGAGHNDFEPVLRKRFPLIDRCLNLMSTEGKPKVTGSGASLFMACQSQTAAEQIERKLKQKQADFQLTDHDVKWVVTRGCNRSLLYSGDLAKAG